MGCNLHGQAGHLLPERLESTARAFDPTAPVDPRRKHIEALTDLSI